MTALGRLYITGIVSYWRRGDYLLIGIPIGVTGATLDFCLGLN